MFEPLTRTEDCFPPISAPKARAPPCAEDAEVAVEEARGRGLHRGAAPSAPAPPRGEPALPSTQHGLTGPTYPPGRLSQAASRATPALLQTRWRPQPGSHTLSAQGSAPGCVSLFFLAFFLFFSPRSRAWYKLRPHASPSSAHGTRKACCVKQTFNRALASNWLGRPKCPRWVKERRSWGGLKGTRVGPTATCGDRDQ